MKEKKKPENWFEDEIRKSRKIEKENEEKESLGACLLSKWINIKILLLLDLN